MCDRALPFDNFSRLTSYSKVGSLIVFLRNAILIVSGRSRNPFSSATGGRSRFPQLVRVAFHQVHVTLNDSSQFIPYPSLSFVISMFTVS